MRQKTKRIQFNQLNDIGGDKKNSTQQYWARRGESEPHLAKLPWPGLPLLALKLPSTTGTAPFLPRMKVFVKKS